ncbi:hypothetical protein CNMCM5793_005917 [Aspergillus hiratsukae]|uniref:Hemerythrin-like domain-containing protein n=1 Tax=Aspergillus hiratsukae TaxID=1194566 RepID=A0A8H6P5C3_9EURO|nr:hypothetical protein CNMCM5793_005917 [Aspergillus hiratsukae]KAF7156649.1 hypothetical protein CNMCM6106_000939 [Aspergillus hiratsukae]
MASTQGRSEPHVLRGNISHQVQAFTDWSQARRFRILDTIKHDHSEIKAFYELIVASSNPDEQTRFRNQFVWELARHAVSEELVVYPAMEKYLDDGKELARRDREEHQTVKEKLHTIQDMKPSDPNFMPTLQSLWADLESHMAHEESEDLLWLEDALSEQESLGLSQSLERTKLFVPSHAHPKAPSAPPFETAVGLLTAPLDRLEDLFRKWPAT